MSIDTSCISAIGYKFKNKKDFYNLSALKAKYNPNGEQNWDELDKELFDLKLTIWEDGYNNDGYLVVGKELSNVDTEEYEQVDVVDNLQAELDDTIKAFKSATFAADLNENPKYISFLYVS